MDVFQRFFEAKTDILTSLFALLKFESESQLSKGEARPTSVYHFKCRSINQKEVTQEMIARKPATIHPT